MTDNPPPTKHTPSPADAIGPLRPDGAVSPPADDVPIYDGTVSMWMGFKTFFASAVLDLIGMACAFYGLSISGSSLSSAFIICGVALLVASCLMLTWSILRIRTHRFKITRKLIEREQGVLTKRIDALDLSRVKDVELKQSIMERMLNIGTIEVFSSDQVAPVLFIEAIPNPRPVYEQLRDAVITIAQKRGVIPMN